MTEIANVDLLWLLVTVDLALIGIHSEHIHVGSHLGPHTCVSMLPYHGAASWEFMLGCFRLEIIFQGESLWGASFEVSLKR